MLLLQKKHQTKAKRRLKNFFRREINRERRDSKYKRISKAFGNYTALDLALVEEDIDWWCKYYASLGQRKLCGSYLIKGYEKMTVCFVFIYFFFRSFLSLWFDLRNKNLKKIFNDELENQKCFDYFSDFCQTFELVRGKTTCDEEHVIVGEFKV